MHIAARYEIFLRHDDSHDMMIRPTSCFWMFQSIIWLVATGTWLLLSHILGSSSSRLIFIFFRGVATTNQSFSLLKRLGYRVSTDTDRKTLNNMFRASMYDLFSVAPLVFPWLMCRMPCTCRYIPPFPFHLLPEVPKFQLRWDPNEFCFLVSVLPFNPIHIHIILKYTEYTIP